MTNETPLHDPGIVLPVGDEKRFIRGSQFRELQARICQNALTDDDRKVLDAFLSASFNRKLRHYLNDWMAIDPTKPIVLNKHLTFPNKTAGPTIVIHNTEETWRDRKPLL